MYRRPKSIYNQMHHNMYSPLVTPHLAHHDTLPSARTPRASADPVACDPPAIRRTALRATIICYAAPRTHYKPAVRDAACDRISTSDEHPMRRGRRALAHETWVDARFPPARWCGRAAHGVKLKATGHPGRFFFHAHKNVPCAHASCHHPYTPLIHLSTVPLRGARVRLPSRV